MKNFTKLAFLSVMTLSGCNQVDAPIKAENVVPNVQVPAIEKTTGQFSDETEAKYLARFETMVESFRNGGATTIYDIFADVASAPNYTPLARGLPDAGMMASLETAEDYAAKNNSLAFMVMHKGRIIAKQYYDEADEKTLINSKSLAKPMGVIAIGRAIQKGYIKSLDQPVSDFIVEWKDTPKDKILLRHLLDMRSGLLEQAWAPEATDVLNRAYLHPYHDEVIIHEYPLKHEPGRRYDYSNANSELVAPIIKRATGVNYEEWVSSEVIEPLGALGGTVWVNRAGGTAHSGCCMQLPAETWLRLGMLVMQDGMWDGARLLPEGFTMEMKTPTPNSDHAGMGVYQGTPYIEMRGYANPDVEFGKTYHSEPYKDSDLYLFDGNSNQVQYFIPSKELIIMRLGNHPPKDNPWDNAFLPNALSDAFAEQ